MKKKCSFCGAAREEITKFKTGYVCDECLDYIRNTDTSDGRHDSRGDTEKEKPENSKLNVPVSGT